MGCVLENVVNVNEIKDKHVIGLSSTINGNNIVKVEHVTMKEKTICLNVDAIIYRKEEQRWLNHDPFILKPRLSKAAYSKTSKNLIVDGSDNALVDNINDISNKN